MFATFDKKQAIDCCVSEQGRAWIEESGNVFEL